MILLNLAYYFIVHVIGLEEIAKKRIKNYFYKQYGFKSEISEISLNDKLINISNLKVYEKNKAFSLKVEQIYIEYELIPLIFTKIHPSKAIKDIHIYNPDLEVNKMLFSANKISKESNKQISFKIPKQYFSQLYIYNGNVTLDFDTKNYTFRDTLTNIEAKIKSKEGLNFQLNSKLSKKGIFKFKGSINKSNSLNFEGNISNYRPNFLKISGIEDLNFELNSTVKYDKDSLDISTDLENMKFIWNRNLITADTLLIQSDLNKLNCYPKNLKFNDLSLKGKAEILSLNNDPQIEAEISTNTLPLDKYVNNVEGNVDVITDIKGDLKSPRINFEAESKSILLYKQLLNDASLKGSYYENSVNFRVNSMLFNQNLIKGKGNYNINKSVLDLSLFSENFSYKLHGFNAVADLEMEASINETDLTINTAIDNLNFYGHGLSISNLNGFIELENEKWKTVLNNNRSIKIIAAGNFDKNIHFAEAELKSLNPNQIIDEKYRIRRLPWISGKLNLEYSEKLVHFTNKLRIFDKRFGFLDGWLFGNMIWDQEKDKTTVNLRTKSGVYHFEPFNFELKANGTSNKITDGILKINDEIKGEFELELDPKINWKIELEAQNLKIKNYAKYYLNFDQINKLEGELNFDLLIDSNSKGKILSIIKLKDFSYGDVGNIELKSKIEGDFKRLNIATLDFFKNEKKIIESKGLIERNPSITFALDGKFNHIDLTGLKPQLKGVVKGDFNLGIDEKRKEFVNIDFKAEQFRYKDFKINKCFANISQNSQKIWIENLEVEFRKKSSLKAKGGLNYNFLTGKKKEGSDSLNIQYEGDLLAEISDFFDFLSDAKSTSSFDLNLRMKENGLSITSGKLNLQNGSIKIGSQPEKLENIDISLNFKENKMFVNEFKLESSENKLLVTNNFEIAENNFIIGGLNLGSFRVRTADPGVRIHIPKYMKEKATVLCDVTGRNTEYAKINGPFDDIKIITDLYLSQGNAIYPPDTKNVLKLLLPKNDRRKKKRKKDSSNLPFSLDLKIHFMDNTRYVTYPANFLIEPESYIHILYDREDWTVPEAELTSKKGTIELFGNTFRVEAVEVFISKYSKDPTILGSFVKKAEDGTNIYLNAYNKTGDITEDKGPLKIELTSDNVNDKTTSQILSRLNYNRQSDEISNAQLNTLLQDEVVQMAGLSVSSAIIDPLISPVENTIRKLFKLDYFSIKTGLIQNIFNRYYENLGLRNDITEAEKIDEESRSRSFLSRFSRDYLFNNLQVRMGKYLSKDLFFDYKIYAEKATDLNYKTDLYLYHDFSLNYSLGNGYDLVSTYYLKPEFEKNSFEILLRKTIRFW